MQYKKKVGLTCSWSRQKTIAATKYFESCIITPVLTDNWKAVSSSDLYDQTDNDNIYTEAGYRDRPGHL